MLMGPSIYFDLENKISTIVVGLVLLGTSINLAMIPCLPEAIDFIIYKYRIVEGFNPELDNKLSNVFSSLFSLINYFFALIAPIIGGLFYDYLPV